MLRLSALRRMVGRPRGLPHRSFSYIKTRTARQAALDELPERVQQRRLVEQLKLGECPSPPSFFQTYASPPRAPDPNVDKLTIGDVGMSKDEMRTLIDAAFATCCLHVESRIAALIGEGFYTIGPCGEELLAPVGMVLRESDPMALHYRHVAVQLARQLVHGKRDLDDVLLDRARGYTVSTQDPVAAGRHCAIGGGPSDFIVTSTLASQGPPAVGRALGIPLAQYCAPDGEPKFPRDAISFVSVGDGSVNNAHFLAAVNTAEYAQARQFKCPVLFAVSDNDICISLHGFGWLGKFLQRLRMPVYECVGLNFLDVQRVTALAADHVRTKGRPAIIVYRDLPRRFAHSGNDREDEYRSKTDISKQQEATVLAGVANQAVQNGVMSYGELSDRYSEIMDRCVVAFERAAAEPKNTSRDYLVQTNSSPLAPAPERGFMSPERVEQALKRVRAGKKGDVMRKMMNLAIEETLETNPEAVYLGEDVGYGGYYKVTDGLSTVFPHRVRDFPPDETSLIGAGVGFSQVGLLPIVEIPYAKYLDCGADMFFEAIIMNWLSNGTSPNGMLIRLQGFGPGVFGGNFHTHNALHMPPGLDVVCFSNGEDYVRGWRYAVAQAKAGRVVMTVDCTSLLNQRHIDPEAKDEGLMCTFPTEGCLTFDDVIIRPPAGEPTAPVASVPGTTDTKVVQPGATLIVTYGTGVAEALRAQSKLAREGILVYVVDTPCLSQVPSGLEAVLQNADAVLFADVCKEGAHPYATTVTRLQNSGALPKRWKCIASAPTYNPLGTLLTFLNDKDIVAGVRAMTKK